MKKYRFLYIISFSILLLLQITHGIQKGVIYHVAKFPIPYRPGTMAYTALLGNLIIVVLCYIMAFIPTINRENKSKIKWLIFLAIVVQSMFVPALKMEVWYESGVYEKTFRTLIETFFY